MSNSISLKHVVLAL